GATPLRYQVCGANPFPADSNGYCSGYATAEQGATTGQSDITWSAGGRADTGRGDTVSTFVDEGADGALDGNIDPQTSDYITWFDRLRVFDTYCGSYYYDESCDHFTGYNTTLRVQTVGSTNVGT